MNSEEQVELSGAGGEAGLTTKIVAAYVGHHKVPAAELGQLISAVYAALKNLGNAVQESARPEPAVPIKKSVTPDYIVCLEDGKKLKMLKRHLRTTYNLTPEEYRVKWGLSPDYPMVAPNYAKRRSEFAKTIGLGRKVAAGAAGSGKGRRRPARKAG